MDKDTCSVYMRYASVAAGDIDFDGFPEVVVAGVYSDNDGPDGDKSGSNKKYMLVTLKYDPNEEVETLIPSGGNVMDMCNFVNAGFDKDDNVQDIAEKVSYAVKADVRDPGILESFGVQNVDVAVIAVAENMEASITATMQVKELGVPFVMAKAMNSLHGRILEKIGADKVIYPEHSMGIRVARNLLSSGFVDMFEPVSYTHLTLPTTSRV